MACGCQSSGDDARTKALVCHLCPWAEHGPSAMNDGAIACTIDGEAVVGRRDCPRGKWRRDGETLLVRSLWWWYGAPMWHRLVVWAMKSTHPKPSSFAGCGCVKVLKDLQHRILAR